MRKNSADISDLQFALIVTVPILFFLIVVVAYPLGYSLWLSFHQIGFFGGYTEEFVGIGNYGEVLRTPEFWRSLGISLRFTIGTVLGTLIVGLALALVMSRIGGRWRWLRAIFILPWAVSPYGAGIFFGYLGREQTGLGTAIASALGTTNTMTFISSGRVVEFLSVGAAWNMAPLLAFFLLANMSTTPQRLYDLADIDGMTAWNKFCYVTLPPLRFTLYVFTCITVVLSFKSFDYIYTAAQGGPGNASSVMTYELYKFSFINLDLGFGAAMSFYLLALILLSTFLLYALWGVREEKR